MAGSGSQVVRTPTTGVYRAGSQARSQRYRLLLAVVVLGAAAAVLAGCQQPPASTTVLSDAYAVYQQAQGRADMFTCYADQRIIYGAELAYEAQDGARKLPGTLRARLALLVPDILPKAPTCPNKGVYSLRESDKAITCSIHGSYADEVRKP